MSEETLVRRYIVEGRVQGVGFRAWVHKLASRVGVVGWVRNLPDGRVESVAAGSARALDEFHLNLHGGPSLAKVKKVTVGEGSLDPMPADFSILHTGA